MIRLKKLVAACSIVLSLTFSTVPPLLLPVGGVTAIVISQASCSKNKAASFTRTAVGALKDTRSILVANSLPTSKLDLAIRAGEAAQQAFQSGAANSLDLASAFITAFEGVVSDVDVIANESLRKTLTIALLVGNIALHALAELLAEDETANPIAARAARASSDVKPIEVFKQKPVWRCRNAATGRFEKAEFCKRNPAISVVEKS